MASLPFSAKYCPKTSKEVRAQDSVIEQVKRFIQGFGRAGSPKAMIIHGGTGTGKTCLVHAIANDLNLEILEFNASDLRNEEGINSVIGSASKQRSLFSSGKVILVDEIDGIAGREDRGGVSALAKVIDSTGFPIIMTANDIWDQKMSALRAKSLAIKVNTPTYLSVNALLKEIAAKEGFNLEEDTLKSVARRAGGDFRSAINDLQSIGMAKDATDSDRLSWLDERNREDTILNALMKIFKTTQMDIAETAFEDVNEELERCMLWVEENIPYEYEKSQDIYRAFDALSKASVFMGRIRKWQHWRYLVYVNSLASSGVAIAKDEKYHKFVQYKPSSRLSKLFRVSQSNKKRAEIAGKMAKATHTSTKEAIQDTLPYARFLLSRKEGSNNQAIAEGLGLDEDDIEWLSKR